MSTDSGWWARRLGNAPVQQQQPNTPPVTYHAAPAPAYQQQAPAYQQQAPTQQIKVTPENLFEAAQHWQGGEATRTETNPCPKCGSPHFFSRSQNVARGPAPAPVCYTCGFNGMFVQGDPSVWQGA